MIPGGALARAHQFIQCREQWRVALGQGGSARHAQSGERQHRRDRIAEVMGATGYTLKWWLIGQGVDMVIVAIR